MKICTKCGQKKPLSEFAKDKSKKDGHLPACKECKKAYDAKYVAENKDKKYAANYAYNAAHREEKRLYDEKRRSELRDEINAKKRAYYHSENGRRINRQWSLANWDKVSISKKNTKHKRRELMRSSTLSGRDLRCWINENEKVCKYCGIDCKESFHVDHIMPLSRGGEHEIENLAIACPRCNTNKNNKTIEEWIASRKIDSDATLQSDMI